ncbi:MAG: DNA gyrase inhibitor YacG [Planctomycetales bacterium]|nr:DNA gyrase inhibitor YacG [Planctomycetales bacterium]
MNSQLRCPVCGKPVDPESPATAMPFCSSRCRDIDLGRWLNEEYGLPAEGQEDVEEIDYHQDSDG